MKKTAIALACGMFAAAPAFAQASNEITQLRETLRALQERITQLETKAAQPAAPAAVPANVVTAGDIPNSWKIPGTNTSLSLGGIVAGSVIVGTRTGAATSSADFSLIPSLIPLNGTAGVRTNYWKLNAQDSTLRFRTFTPTEYGPLASLIEGDFYGTGGTELGTNGHGFRLKHAWFTLGNFGVGQYWANAVNMTAYPESVEYSPDMGLFGALRQVGFRYTQPMGGKNFWAVSVENPESVVVVNSANTGASTMPDNDKFPDLSAKVHFGLGSGEFEVSSTMRKITSAPGVTQQSKWGYGIGVSGFIPFMTSGKLMFGVSTSKGSGRHLVGLLPDDVLIGTTLAGVNTVAGFVSLKHYWTPTLRSNLTYSFINADNPAGLSAGTAAGINKEFRAAHANLIWAATPRLDLGAELLRGSRTVESGASGATRRFVFSTRYYF